MRRSSEFNIEQNKRVARKKYSERQFDKWVKWKWNAHGSIKYKDIVKQLKKHNLWEKTNGH